jgi:hypothetical protein
MPRHMVPSSAGNSGTVSFRMVSVVTAQTVRCESCCTLNRLPNHSINRVPVCGRCRSKLPEARSAPIGRATYRVRILIAAVSVVGTLASAVAVATIFVRRAARSVKAAGTDTSNVACAKYSSTLQALNGEYEPASARPAGACWRGHWRAGIAAAGIRPSIRYDDDAQSQGADDVF